MFRNYLLIAWRSARRDRLHTVINLLGLSLGLAGAILLGLFVRNEATFERFIPGYQDVYVLESVDYQHGVRISQFSSTPAPMAKPLRLAFPEIQSMARFTMNRVGVSQGEVEANELVNSVDPEFFQVLPFRFVRGDAASALASPDAAVLTHQMAIKYFGTDDCLGQTLLIDRKDPVRVGGVVADLPPNTDFYFGILVNGQASFSWLGQIDALPPRSRDDYTTDDTLYVRLKPGASTAGFKERLDKFADEQIFYRPGDPLKVNLVLTKLADQHTESRSSFDDTGGPMVIIGALILVGVMILVVAGINFVNLTTAQATKRALEVGVRKVAGATRGQLFVQFMFESVIYAFLSAIIALAVVELTLPSFNAWIDRALVFDYWRDWQLAIAIIAVTLVYGLAAGVYPALVLSGFRPGVVLKRQTLAAGGSGHLRQALVIVQFTISIALLVATVVVYRQTKFATDEILKFDRDQIVLVSLNGLDPDLNKLGDLKAQPAIESFRQRLAGLPGVRMAAAASSFPGDMSNSSSTFRVLGHPEIGAVETERQAVDFGVLELYGLKPLAGRSFSRDHLAEDQVSFLVNEPGSIIINETALRHFGFASPAAAIDQQVYLDRLESDHSPKRIIGVVPDLAMHKITASVQPMVFGVSPDAYRFIILKLDGKNLSQTLGAIDAAWRQTVPARPITRWFLDDRIERLYHDTKTQGQGFALFAAIASMIGCLGLFGLSAYTAQRRIKEIGIRKALGASSSEILRLLLWQFAKPVLIANAIAWPIAWALMRSWLQGFAYRVELDWTPFAMAGAGALAIALGTTAFHALMIARQRPVRALRYE